MLDFPEKQKVGWFFFFNIATECTSRLAVPEAGLRSLRSIQDGVPWDFPDELGR